jgi:two-component system, cell cycle response regulator
MTTGRCRILVVDDDPLLTELLEDFLHDSGYSVEIVGTARDMLQRCSDSPPDLILLDVMLPDRNGFEALEELRESKNGSRVPVIMLTALSEPSYRTRGIRTGADDYLGKPFDLDELLSRVGLRLHQALEIQRQRNAAVNAGLMAIGTVAASERVEDVISRVVALTRELLASSACAVMFWDESERCFVPAGSGGLGEEQEARFNSLRIRGGTYEAIDELVHHRHAFECREDCSGSLADWLLETFQVEVAIGVPISRGQDLYGMLIVGRRAQEKEYAEADVGLLMSIASQAGMALANLRAIEELEQRAVTDALTGLYNPRYLREFLHHQIERAKRSGESTAVLMLDLDNFKQINDLHGHLTGDEMLVAVASAIRDSVRSADVVARYGGDEYAVVLPGADRQQGLAIGARILERVMEREIEAEGVPVRTTVSAGLAVAPPGKDPQGLMEAADRALYAAKAAGRNCIR